MRKLDISTTIGLLGLTLATSGIAMLSIPVALIALGSFLVWITEKAN